MVDVRMPRDDIPADIHYHLEHVLDGVDGVDYSHNVRRADVAVVRVHTYAGDVVEDSMDYDDVASRGPACAAVPPTPDVSTAVVVAYPRACVIHCKMDVVVPASDTPCDVVALVSFHQRRRRHHHHLFSPDSSRCACLLHFHKKLFLRLRVASTPHRPYVQQNHVRMVHRCQIALGALREMKRTCYIRFCYVCDSTVYQEVDILPFVFHIVFDHLLHCIQKIKKCKNYIEVEADCLDVRQTLEKRTVLHTFVFLRPVMFSILFR